MTRLDWLVVVAIATAPWVVLLVALEVAELRRRGRRRRRGGLVAVRPRVGYSGEREEPALGRRRAGS